MIEVLNMVSKCAYLNSIIFLNKNLFVFTSVSINSIHSLRLEWMEWTWMPTRAVDAKLSSFCLFTKRTETDDNLKCFIRLKKTKARPWGRLKETQKCSPCGGRGENDQSNIQSWLWRKLKEMKSVWGKETHDTQIWI